MQDQILELCSSHLALHNNMIQLSLESKLTFLIFLAEYNPSSFDYQSLDQIVLLLSSPFLISV